MKQINVTRPSMPPLDEYVEEIRGIWDNRWLTHTGPKHEALREALSQRFGGAQVSLFCNGHLALEAAFSLFPAGSEVITTPFTFASTTLAIARCGLVPVFCDIEPDFYTIDPAKIEPLITGKTVAIAPVHVYGNLCDWRSVGEVAGRHGLKVIYDAAHAFGVKDGDVPAARLGDISMFSFHATKVFHAIEGGCLAYASPELAKTFSAWRQYGMLDGENSQIVGTNAKMTEFSAAMGLCNLRHIDEQIGLRRRAAERYEQRLSGQKGLILCPTQPSVTRNYAYMPVRVVPGLFGCTCDDVAAGLEARGIRARKYFHPLTSQMPSVAAMMGQHEPQLTPVAQQVSRQILCLPLYADLEVSDVDMICDAVLELRAG